MSTVGLLFGLMWMVLSWRPVFPALDRVIASILSKTVGGLSGYLMFAGSQGDKMEVGQSLLSLKEQCRALANGCLTSLGWLAAIVLGLRKWVNQNHGSEYFKIFLVRVNYHQFFEETFQSTF